MKQFDTIEDLGEHLALKDGQPWFAVEDSSEDLYLIFVAEDEDAYQGIPQETDPDEQQHTGVDSNVGALDDFPGRFPVYLLARHKGSE